MIPTKLSHLEKETLLSKWQKEQIRLQHQNNQFFLPIPQIADPWEQERQKKKVIESQIPALQNTQWGSRFRSNKDMNNNINNTRILTSNSMFNQKY